MPAPHKFTRKLHEVIGVEAAEAMVDWMNRTDERFDELRADLAELRQEMNGKLSDLRGQMNTGLAEVRGEMRAGFANVEAGAAKRHADVMKWTLGFWVASLLTYVGALVALAQVLR